MPGRSHENESVRQERYITGMKKSSISRDGQVDRQTDMNSHGCAINTVFIDTHYRLFIRNRYLRYYQFGNTNQERFSFYIYRLRAPRPRIGSPAQFSTRAFLILAIKKPWYQYCKGPMVPSTLEAYCF